MALTLEADYSQDLHNAVRLLFPFATLPFHHSAHARRAADDGVSRIVNQVRFCTYNDYRNT